MNSRSTSWRIPALILGLLCAGFLGYVLFTAGQLPECVASHFGDGGKADDWMTREGFLVFEAAVGLGLPLFLVGLFFVAQFFPDGLWHMPHREYWLAPERREETTAYFFRQSFWLASLLVCLIAAMHYVTLDANRRVPAHLCGLIFWPILGCFLAGVATWGTRMVLHFKKTG